MLRQAGQICMFTLLGYYLKGKKKKSRVYPLQRLPQNSVSTSTNRGVTLSKVLENISFEC